MFSNDFLEKYYDYRNFGLDVGYKLNYSYVMENFDTFEKVLSIYTSASCNEDVRLTLTVDDVPRDAVLSFRNYLWRYFLTDIQSILISNLTIIDIDAEMSNQEVFASMYVSRYTQHDMFRHLPTTFTVKISLAFRTNYKRYDRRYFKMLRCVR